MARVHKWYFLVNQAGEPIEGAGVWITLAGTGGKTGTAAWIYFDEFGSGGTRDMPQCVTLENGYFEFWVDEDEDFDLCGVEIDNETTQSYGFNQKFRLDWDKTNVHTGYVDYVDIFPPNRFFEKVDLTDCTNTALNKVVSNELACKWNVHADADLRFITDPFERLEAHGVEVLDTTNPNNTTINKILSNDLGWVWDSHELTNVWEYSLAPSASRLGGLDPTKSPHDLHPVNISNIFGDEGTKFNKVVSNVMMADIRDELNEISQGIFTVDIGSGYDAQWLYDAGEGYYYVNLTHSLDIEFPHVSTYRWDATNAQYEMDRLAEVYYIDVNTIKIVLGSGYTTPPTPELHKVRIST
jgi:hypothetical protein